jgi:zinc transporter 9
MEELWHIIMLSSAMFFGSYISGLVPLGFTLERDQINQMNVAGSGLLIGTALSVIIPEGVSALYSNKHHQGP